MESEEEAMELVGAYGAEGLGGLEEEGPDQQVPQVPSPLEERGGGEERAQGEQMLGSSAAASLAEVGILEGLASSDTAEEESGAGEEFNDGSDEEEQEVVVPQREGLSEGEGEEDLNAMPDTPVVEASNLPPAEASGSDSDITQDAQDVDIKLDVSDEQNNYEEEKDATVGEPEKEPLEMDVVESIPDDKLKQSVRAQHPGVFEVSEPGGGEEVEEEMEVVGEKEEEAKKQEEGEKAKEILDSLPVLEMLRGLSRAGSVSRFPPPLQPLTVLPRSETTPA
jgi:hypothetical protein